MARRRGGVDGRDPQLRAAAAAVGRGVAGGARAAPGARPPRRARAARRVPARHQVLRGLAAAARRRPVLTAAPLHAAARLTKDSNPHRYLHYKGVQYSSDYVFHLYLVTLEMAFRVS